MLLPSSLCGHLPSFTAGCLQMTQQARDRSARWESMFAACSELGAGDAPVSIVNFVFAPPQVVIEAGQSVTWINDYGTSHGVAIADVSSGTDPLLPGATFSRHFVNE